MIGSREELKARVNQEIDRRSESLIQTAKHIMKNPESGFKEIRTSQTVQDWFRDLGIPYTDNLAITGIKGVVNGKAGEGPTIAVIGELDSMVVPGHPEEDPATHAAHACGHHIQIGNMLGVTAGILGSGVLEELSGRVVFMAVPAEEYIELEFRNELRKQGKIEFLTGKGEFIRLGAFDDVDMAVMTHSGSVDSEPAEEIRDLMIGTGNNGLVAKRAEFIGRASHAGGSPWRGINALNAATLAIQAIHMQRETFRDEDSIRVHPIITRGGSAVNAIPDSVHIETYVRGRSLDAILEANAKVDRALRAGAMAIGARVRIINLGEMLPLINDPEMASIYRANAEMLVGADNVGERGHGGGSTDMGDVSHIMPALHPHVNAATGQGHGVDYLIQDYPLAVITAAKAMANMVVDLLSDGARAGKEIVANHTPLLTKQRYVELTRGLYGEEIFPGEDQT
jgi:amidohydrolase